MMTRREGIKAAALTALSYARVRGANDRVQLGLVGCGERGLYVCSFFQKTGQVDVRAVCDVWGDRADKGVAQAPGAQPFGDHRKLLEVSGLDAVLIATPDHWHKDVAIDALNAGKDVYVEKPLTRRREEGPDIVRAARVNNRVCQVGMQQRSGEIYLEARERFVASGKLGKISHVDCVWHSGAAERLPTEPAQKPANLDWVRFLGPLKYRDWNPAQYLDFRAFLDFGGGKLTDFGAHWMDVVHMFMGQDGPLSAVAAGGVYNDFHDGRTAPDTISALYEYPGDFSVSFSSLAVPVAPDYGVAFLGSGGRLFVDRHHYEFRSAEKDAPPVVRSIPGDITDAHVRNFLDCCRSRKLPNADVYIGHRAAQAALLANQSYLERRRIRFDPQSEQVLPFSA
ncbi:MAG TPA: Gfo/Idh/MocA family oxidoreductase [Bryobacteraceae bacterium]|nr:Gfo/Idh/MocA family oxidoreductase [Bryobacteraceae bacterium]